MQQYKMFPLDSRDPVRRRSPEGAPEGGAGPYLQLWRRPRRGRQERPVSNRNQVGVLAAQGGLVGHN